MPTLLLLPGLDGTGRLLEDFAAAVGDRCRVITVDYPTDIPLGYDDLEPLVRRALPADDEPLVVLGESFSGPLAVRVAAAPPANLRGVVLCCTFVRGPRPHLGRLLPLARAVPLTQVPETIVARVAMGRDANARLTALLTEALASVAPAVVQRRLEEAVAVDATAELAAVRVPVLYLRALRDRVIPHQASRLVAEVCPATRIVDFASSHLLLQTRPAEAATVVADFAREVCGGAWRGTA